MKSELKYLLLIIIISFGLSSITLSLINLTNFIPQFFTLAIVDSVNPCTFVVYTIFLIALSVKGLPKRALYVVGLAFILAVYVSYYTLGVGLMIITGKIPVSWAGYLAITFGIYEIVTGALEKPRTVGKGKLRKLAFSTEATIVGGLILGFAVSTTLLPCSMGPYVVYATIVSKMRALAYLLLALYNLIFVLPLFIILFAMGSLSESKKFSRAMVKHSRELSIIAGILLIGIGVWVLR
ncbi:cytochrome c biogenesis CcdA family protein [Pyrococcus sp. ST04]|uniref:cytochrome c biogenesis CcdA family protein n=1 Tax=Pyrococcus sp. ST04 TaxID=1183377 RepID=UPI0002605CE6|nr:cytochrome c biogenesis CcdA family protein [Pyrococcus sp. ST04]AFK22424.1 putative Cytochrome C biogenesis protein [Pyrococcus sp. ST04]